jgi:hypothetical protein
MRVRFPPLRPNPDTLSSPTPADGDRPNGGPNAKPSGAHPSRGRPHLLSTFTPGWRNRLTRWPQKPLSLRGRVGSNPTPGTGPYDPSWILPNVRSIEEVRQVASFVASGLNDCEIERRTGIPRRTIVDWRHTQRWEQWSASSRQRRPQAVGCCSCCGAPGHVFDELPRAYVYLLGMYLGDGHIVLAATGVHRLTIAMDGAYPCIVSECAEAIRAVVPGAPPFLRPQKNGRCVYVVNYSKQLPCLFPQHGPGRKHERPIALSSWQHELVERCPERFLRGLIHSDGCSSINHVRHGEKVYAYPRETFSNASADIRRLFCDACDLLGIKWRVMNARNLSVARRESVARLDEFIGPKR